MRYEILARFLIFFSARVAPSAINFIILLVGTVIYPPDDYISLSLFLTLIPFLSYCFYGWINQICLREDLSSSINRRFEFVTLNLLFACAVMFLCSLSALLISELSIYPILGALFQSIHLIAGSFLQNQGRNKSYAKLEFSRFFLLSLMILFFYFFRFKVEILFLLYCVVIMVNIVFFFWPAMIAAKSSFISIFGESNIFSKKYTKIFSLFKRYFWVSVWVSMSLSMPVLDRFIIQYFLQENQLFFYSLYSDFIYRSYVFVLLPTVVFFQVDMFKSYRNGDFLHFSRLLKRSVYIQVLMFMFFFSGLFVFSHFFMSKVIEGFLFDWRPFASFSLLCFAWHFTMLHQKEIEAKLDFGILSLFLFITLVCYVSTCILMIKLNFLMWWMMPLVLSASLLFYNCFVFKARKIKFFDGGL
ncbi:hypothetical protein EMM73_06625 [Rheinheimera sediminis]|uniref:hypothetical protein n=1 Tax=Rheinheimera sp. YQF-1 TaxID=2499626 RepID=UPI000FDAC149|nr:hypothetical protein [Rheinheimera sp. YQF-1]RVT46857.1 hypothetical protein EMM73_06625 [Rheinheimera sp. YQF-1]